MVETLPLPAPGTIARASARGIVGREKGARTLTMALLTQAPVAAPRELRARLAEDGVRLEWAGEVPKPVSAVVPPPSRPGFPSPALGPDGRPLPARPPGSAPPTAVPPPAVAAPASAAPPAGPPASGGDPGRDASKATTVEVRAAGFHVYRRVGTESYRLPLHQEPLAELHTTDTTAPQGGSACYVVRAAACRRPARRERAVERGLPRGARHRAARGAHGNRGAAARARPRGALDAVAGGRTSPATASIARRRASRAAALAEVEAARSAWLDTGARPGISTITTSRPSTARATRAPAPPAVEASLP